jgi:hypothetical protein
MSPGQPITDAERAIVLAGLDEGFSLSEIAKQMGIAYGRAYRIANLAGALDAKREATRIRREQAEQKKREDEARLPVLLAAYYRGELVDDNDPAAKFYETLLVHRALDSGDPKRILEKLDGLVAIKDSASV